MNEKMVTLPERAEMFRRLLALNSNPHLVKYLYPRFLACAGEERTADGVVLLVTTTMQDYTSNMQPVMLRLTLNLAPLFVRLLIDDPDVEAEALASLNGALRQLQP